MKTFVLFTIVGYAVFFTIPSKAQQIKKERETYTDTIPLGGNAWVNAPAIITDSGLVHWSKTSSITSIYFKVNIPQEFNLSLRLKVREGNSKINLASGNTNFSKQISNTSFTIIHFGKLSVTKSGYVRIDLKGMSKTGAVFADVLDLMLQHAKPDSNLVYVKKGSSFHFGRRGPSVHLRYPIPDDFKNDIRWFYNEITVPSGMDKLGSYFMADGFGEGYFGMQVNSETERRILFSVWSPFETQNPKDIPDSLQVILLKKGTGVQANVFGNEGSGGQSYLRFSWQAGNTYAFLLGAQPDSVHHATTYTAYFKDISAGKWYLIAVFKRPQTTTYLTHLYSFLENFIPENGDQTRMGHYKNQWIKDSNNNWRELTNAVFTVDATAKGGYRSDYAGGTDGNCFFLRNDGFFNESVRPNQSFNRKPTGKQPVIDFDDLPQQ